MQDRELYRQILGIESPWKVERVRRIRLTPMLAVARMLAARLDNILTYLNSDNQTVQDFRYKVLRELKKIKLAWPELHYSTARGVLILHPSTPAIPPSPVPPRRSFSNPHEAGQSDRFRA